MRILLVEDHKLFRESIATAVLDDELGNPTVFEAASLAEALALIDMHHSLDLVLVDLELEGASGAARSGGLRLLEVCRERLPDTPIIVLTASESGEDVRAAWRMGARGYLSKKVSSHEMKNGIRAVLEGGRYLPTHLLPYVHGLQQGVSEPAGGAPRVTPRQREVLRLLTVGKTNKEIGRELGMSEGTVKQHVHNLLDDFGCSNRTELAAMARGAGRLD